MYVTFLIQMLPPSPNIKETYAYLEKKIIETTTRLERERENKETCRWNVWYVKVSTYNIVFLFSLYAGDARHFGIMIWSWFTKKSKIILLAVKSEKDNDSHVAWL